MFSLQEKIYCHLLLLLSWLLLDEKAQLTKMHLMRPEFDMCSTRLCKYSNEWNLDSALKVVAAIMSAQESFKKKAFAIILKHFMPFIFASYYLGISLNIKYE